MQRSLIAVALLLLAVPAAAQVYKWTDAGGTVHYSESPPAQGTKFSKVTTTGTVVAPEAVSSAPAGAASSAARPGAPAAAATSAKPMADTPENRKKLCDSLQANLTALQGIGPVAMQQDGKSTTLDAAQRKQKLDATQAQYAQYCRN